jgi:hypothetical protein
MTGIRTIATVVYTVWVFAITVGRFGELAWMIRHADWLELVWRASGRIHQEMWPLVPAALLITVNKEWNSPRPWLIVFDTINLWTWWTLRNWPEDNRWKRRGKQAKEAVAVRAGRLVVVPAGAKS